MQDEYKHPRRLAFVLDCQEWNPTHIRFNLFDPRGANCGTITILTPDIQAFIANWNGDFRWNNHPAT